MQDFDKLWDYNEPEKTVKKFHDILDVTDANGHETYVAQLYTQLARTQSLQGNWDAAHDYLNKAKSLLSKADNVTEVRYLLELGRTYNSSGDAQQAYDLFVRAWDLAKENQADGYAVDAAHMVAIAADGYQATLDWNLKALTYAEKSSEPAAQKWKASLYNNIGWTYFDNGNAETALDMFKKALAERKKNKDVNNIRVAKWCIAFAQRALGQVETALEIQLTLLAEHEASNSQDEYVYEELAHCYKALEDSSNAAQYASLAYAILSKQDHIPDARLDVLKAMM